MSKRSGAAALCFVVILVILHLGTAIAQTSGAVTDFITVQPIDVCAADGTNCARMNNLGTGQNTIAAGSNVQIGFASNGINITRQILNQAGLDVVFQPAVQYLAPNSGLQSPQVVQTQITPTSVFDSSAFRTLSQQSGVSQGNAPVAPLSSNPTTLNMFFVNSLVPDPSTPGTLYGLGWIGNNGVAISASSFGGVGRGGQTVNARADTIAHEISHNLGLDHTTFGNVDGNGVSPPSDLMTAGATRSLPNVSVPTPPSQNNAVWLSQIAAGTVDQLNPQQAAQITDPTLNHFVNPIPLVQTTITDPTGASGLPLNNSVAFNPANLASGIGRPGESLLSFTFALNGDFFFDTGSFSRTGGTEGIIGTPRFSSCIGESECSQLTISFANGNTFTNLDFFNYLIDVCGPGEGEEGNCYAPSLNDLAGSTYTYRFSDGFSTTSDLVAQIVSDLDPLVADSQHPDLSIPTALDLSLFTPLFSMPCVVTTPNGACPALVLADADPREENAVPEPSSLLLVIFPFGATLVFMEARRQRGRRRMAITPA